MFKQTGFETRAQSHGADGGGGRGCIRAISLAAPSAWCSANTGKAGPWCGQGARAARRDGGRERQARPIRHHFTFTPDAGAFASKNGIHLLDIDKLLALIASPHASAASRAAGRGPGRRVLAAHLCQLRHQDGGAPASQQEAPPSGLRQLSTLQIKDLHAKPVSRAQAVDKLHHAWVFFLCLGWQIS